MPPARIATALAALLACLLPTFAFAHGDLHERINALSEQIAAQPADAALRLQRADLYRQHGEFPLALAELDAAAQLPVDRRILLLARARVFSDAGQNTNACHAADDLLALENNSVEAFTLRARCRFKLNEVAAAVADFNAAIANAAAPEPDLYLERARAQAALGRFAEAIAGLDAGMARLGATPSLELAALEFERQRGAFDAALARADKLVANQPVKEPWQVLRAEILLQAGRPAAASEEFRRAIAGLAVYPAARRGLPMTRDLHARAQAGLARADLRIASTAQPGPPKHNP